MSTYYDYDGTGGRRPGLRTVTIVAAAVAALCVAFLLGFLAHGGRSSAANAAPTARPSRTTPPAPAATSPGGPVSAEPSRPGSPAVPLSRNSAGVIVGYGNDQPGAVAAAGNYTAALYVQTNRTHTRELAVLSSIATTTADATRMAGDFSSEDAALAKMLDVADLQAPGVIAYGHPLGYRIEFVTAASATVDVYVAGGQGVAGAPSDSGAAGETFYEVDQVQLSWQTVDGTADWRLSNWSHLVQSNGPELATIAAQGYLPFPIGQTDAAPNPAGDGS